MNQPATVFVYTLLVMGKITGTEADLLNKALAGQEVPQGWRAMDEQIFEILGRTLL